MSTTLTFSSDRSPELVLVFVTPQNLPEHVETLIHDSLQQAFSAADEQLLSGEGLEAGSDKFKHSRNQMHDKYTRKIEA